EIPEIAEEILRQCAARADVGVLITIKVKAQLQGLPSHDFRDTIVEVVGRLVKDAWAVRAKNKCEAADVAQSAVQNILGKSEGLLGIGLQLVKVPARNIESRFVDQSRSEGVFPQQRGAFVLPIGVPQIRWPRITVEKCRVVGHPIDAESK